jgi:hypothetical protein
MTTYTAKSKKNTRIAVAIGRLVLFKLRPRSKGGYRSPQIWHKRWYISHEQAVEAADLYVAEIEVMEARHEIQPVTSRRRECDAQLAFTLH